MTNTESAQNAPRSEQTAREAASDLRERVVEEGRSIKSTAGETVRGRVDDARKGVADEVGSVGDALRKASEELRGGSPQEQLFATAADSLAELADKVRGRDAGQLLSDVNDFGRRHPFAFLGGAALLGFAGVRMAKASRRDEPEAAHPSPASRPAQPSPYGKSL